MIIVIKKWDHLHLDAMEEPYLVNRYVDHMISRPEEEIGFFGGLIRVGRSIGPPQEVQIRKSQSRLLIYSITSGTMETSLKQALSLVCMMLYN